MVLGFPLAIWLGVLTFISLLTTACLGVATHKGKRTFKYHRFFAFLTIILAVSHIVFVFLWLNYGINF